MNVSRLKVTNITSYLAEDTLGHQSKDRTVNAVPNAVIPWIKTGNRTQDGIISKKD